MDTRACVCKENYRRNREQENAHTKGKGSVTSLNNIVEKGLSQLNFLKKITLITTIYTAQRSHIMRF